MADPQPPAGGLDPLPQVPSASQSPQSALSTATPLQSVPGTATASTAVDPAESAATASAANSAADVPAVSGPASTGERITATDPMLVLPPSIPIEQLALALMTATDPPPFTSISPDRIVSPDRELILYLYSLVLRFPSLRTTVEGLEREKVEWIARDAATRDAMASLSAKNDELESRLARHTQESLELVREKDGLFAEVTNLQNQLGSSQIELENEKREATAAREERARLDAELASANSQIAASRTEVESERKAKEMVSSEKDRLAAELTGVSAQLSTLRSSSESGIRHAAEIRGRLEQVEQEKRDILGSLQREREESTRKAQEIDALLKRNRDARHDVSRLTSEVQESRSQENSAKFKLRGLEQELQLTRKDAEWAHNELVKANEASATFRSAKRLEISNMQSDLDAARQELGAARSKVASLQTAYDETSNRLNQSASKVAELQSRIAAQESSFRSEMSIQNQQVLLCEKRADHALGRIEELEEQWEAVLNKCRVREEAAWKETEAERAAREQLEAEKEELSLALDRLADGVGIGSAAVDDRNSGPDLLDFDADASSEAGRDFDGQSRSSTPVSRRFGRTIQTSTPRLVGLSNAAEFASKAQKSGKTFSQIYVDLAKTQEELRRERLESTRLGNVLAQVMEELQERAPQLQAQREETERLERDLEEMLKQVATSSEERDEYRSQVASLKLNAEKLERENGLLSQQLGDFGRQVRDLMKEIIIRDDPSAIARLEDDGTLLSELEAAAPIPETGDESDTQAVITAQLVTFRSLSELCAQNARLLQVTRQLGAKMEQEERNFKAKLAEDENHAVAEARNLIVRLEEEVRSERYKIEELTNERDMFRHLCATGGRNSLVGTTDSDHNGAAGQSQSQTANAAGPASFEYEALRKRYESLKNEHDAEARMHREVLQSLNGQIGAASASAAQEKAQREAIEERYASLQRSFELHKVDLGEASKRAQTLSESLARKDLATHAAEEQAIEARTASERLRTQVATLQAEKDLWKSTEAKLLEESRSTLVERNNLQELIRNTQSMQAELEARGNDVRIRLEQDVKRLEDANDDLKAKLQNEMEMYRQLSLRREVESKDLHARIDLAGTELSNAREALAVARTSADSAQLRIEDLTKQLEATKDKLTVYERREQLSRDPINFQAAQPRIELSREEQLEIELADLKAGRAAAQIEVQQARVHVEQSQALLREKEVQLATLQASYEELKTASESALGAKGVEVGALQTQVQTLAVDLTSAQDQVKALRLQLEKQQADFQADKKSLEDAIAELGSVEERAKAEQDDVRGEIRKHVKQAKDAEARFAEAEKGKQALAAEANEAKEQLQRVRQETGTLRSQKDRAEAEWGREKAGWEGLKQGLEKEKSDLQRRIDDLTAQNQILHTHLETISAQANEIRQAAAAPLVSAAEMVIDPPVAKGEEAGDAADQAASAPTETEPAAPTDPATNGATTAAATTSETSAGSAATATVTDAPGTVKGRIDELHEVIKYLRREKEIVDLQMELNKQETARLKQSLDHANKLLDETRSQLSEERSRSASAASNAGQHAELLEKINELNGLREANATLKEEAERSAKRIGQLEALLSTANGELQPLKDQLMSAQVELESCQAQLNVVQEDNKRWQARAQGLLQTHGIGEEMKKVEEQKAEAQRKVEEVERKLEEQAKETETVRGELQTSKTNFEKLREQVRARISTERRTVAEWQEKAATLQKEKDETAAILSQHEANVTALTEERDKLAKELETVRAEASAAGAAPAAIGQPSDAEATDAVTAAPAENLVERQQAIDEALQAARKEWDEAKAQLEKEKTEAETVRDRHLQKGREFLRNQRAAEALVKQHEETIKQLREDFANNHTEAIDRAAAEKSAQQSSAEATASSEATLDQLKARVVELERALEAANLRVKDLEAQLSSQSVAEGSAAEAGASTSAQEVVELREQLRVQEAELATKFAAQQKEAVEASFLKGKASADQNGSVASASVSAESVEEQVQQRLKALEDERETARQQAIKDAVDAKERELKAQHEEAAKARFEAGKNEANLRNQLIVKQRDNRIAKLQAEIAELKGEAPPAAAAAATPAAVSGATSAPASGIPVPTGPASNPAGPARPGVFARGGAPNRGRGGTVARPTATPATATAAANSTAPAASIRGRSVSARGAQGGGAQTAGAKRKLSVQGGPASAAGQGEASGSANSGAQTGTTGGTVKKQRAAGGPVPLKRPGGGGGGGT